jgi:glycosyltransferase involved in cell wall biosynthesis
MKSLLFICWDGPQVYYLEGLFLPILKGLRDEYRVHVLQFTWGDEAKSALIRRECAALGIMYNRYPVRRRPVVMAGALWTLAAGTSFIKRYVDRHAIEIVIHRGIFPSFMAARALKNNRRIRKVMDADGLPLEERVDFAGLNPNGLQYRFLKSNEAIAIKRADIVLVRTGATISILAPESEMARKFFIVLNGRDSGFFRPLSAKDRSKVREELGIAPSGLVLVYAGSMGPQYCAREMIRLWEILNGMDKEAHFLILTGTPEAVADWELDHRLLDRLIVKSVPFSEMPRYLGAADVGIAIRKTSLSMKGVSPVKLGEYLLCGLPVIASRGIGDTEAVLTGKEACFLLADHSEASLQKAASWVRALPVDRDTAEEARRTGLAHFGLEESIYSYRNALNHIG